MNFAANKFIEYYKAHPWQMSLNVLMAFTFPVDDFLIPYLTGKIVNAAQKRQPWIRTLIYLILVLVISQIVYALASWHDAKIIPDMQNFIRHEMVADYMKHFEFSHKEPVIGEVMSRLIKIPIVLTSLFEEFKNYVLMYLISFIVTSVYIMSQDMILGGVVLVCVLSVFVLVVLSPSSCMSKTSEQDYRLSQVDEEIEDALRNMKNIHMNNQVEYELQRLKGFEDKYTAAYMDTTVCTIGTKFIGVAILVGMLAFIGYRSYTGIKNKTLTTGAFVAIFIIITQWFGTLSWLVSTVKDVTMNWGIIDAYEKMMKKEFTRATVASEESASSLLLYGPIQQKGIYIDTLTFGIENKIILDGLTLHIYDGDRVALMGEIGSGKTTLIKLMAGLLKPSSGDVYVDGIPLSTLGRRDLMKLVCYAPQHPVLFNRTIYENIIYGIGDGVSKEYVKNLVAELGLGSAIDLDAPAGKNGSALSGGQKQLVSLMRVLLINPKVILLDEITSSIDENTKHKLYKVLERLFKGKTVIMVTHDKSMLQLASAIFWMDHGRIVKVDRK